MSFSAYAVVSLTKTDTKYVLFYDEREAAEF